MAEFTLGTMYWINPRLTSDEVLHDFSDIQANGFSLVRVIAWWELVEPEEGNFTFDHLDRVFRAAEQQHLQLMPTIGFYPPVWLTRKLDAIGKNESGRYPMVLRKEMQRPLGAFIEKLVTRYRNSNVLAMWNVWNEPTVNDSVNSDRLAHFADWLKRHYLDFDQLKQAWFGEYPVFSLLLPHSMEELTAEWLADAFRYGTRGRDCMVRHDWLVFLTDELNAEIRWVCQEVKRYDATHPTHTNIHSLSGNPLNNGHHHFRLVDELDTVSCSIHTSNDYPGGKEFYAPLWNFSFCAEQCYSWTKGRKHTMIGELQAGTTNSHWCRYCPTVADIRYELCHTLGTGLDGVVFWLWRGWRTGTFELGEFSLRNPADGSPTERSEEIRQFGESLKKYKISLTGLVRPAAKIALLYSQSTFLYRKVIAKDRPFHLESEPSQAIFGCYRALREANYQVDILSEEEVLRGELSRYSMLYLPMTEVIGAQTAEAIKQFVAAGGALYGDGRCGWLDDPMYLRNEIPGNGLAEVFGAKETDCAYSQDSFPVRTQTQGISAGGMKQKLSPEPEAQVIGWFGDGSVAVVDHVYGRGRTRLAGGNCCQNLYDHRDVQTSQWIASFPQECGVKPDAALPYGVVRSRLIGKQIELWIIHNHEARQVPIHLPFSGQLSGVFYGTPVLEDSARVSFVLDSQATEVIVLQK